MYFVAGEVLRESGGVIRSESGNEEGCVQQKQRRNPFGELPSGAHVIGEDDRPSHEPRRASIIFHNFARLRVAFLPLIARDN